jgi:signal peptidase II
VGRSRRLLVVALVLAASVGCDRITKNLAETHLKGTPTKSFLSDTVRLQYVENQGAFMSLGSSWPPRVRFWVFTLGTGVALVALGATILVGPTPSRLWLLGWTLFLSGGIGNLWDRILRAGQVVDFLNLGLGPVRTAVFNGADLAIVAGACLLLAGARRLPPEGTRT